MGRWTRTLEPAALAGVNAGEVVGLADGSGVLSGESGSPPASTTCDHCGEPCKDGASMESEGHVFCCQGCQTVFSLLQASGLEDFYQLGERPGRRVELAEDGRRWEFLDDPTVTRQLLDFDNGKLAKVTFHVPAIHCVACVWLLENLFRLNPGIGKSRVNFARREVAITYAPEVVRLSGVATLMERIGYAPVLTLAALDRGQAPGVRRLGLQIGIAGFAFGNIMLFSLPSYFGLDSWSGPLFRTWFGALSLLLALPVLIYSASDYWRSALASLRQRVLTLDVPIAAGLAALYLQSAWEILGGFGEGYLDSTAGLIFFLLCGRAFQQKTHEHLGFDRDYRGFFPLSVLRRTARGDESVSISQVQTGDCLVVRNGELVPADARLIGGEGLVDYSFVTGESDPVPCVIGDHVYAGGRQVGGAIELETVKPVSQSYLTSLWNDEAFRKQRDNSLETLTNRYSRRFTVIVVCIALAAVTGWLVAGQPGRALKAFTSVLIVACPCALALAAPFTLGTAQRVLARLGIFLRNGQVVENMAVVDTLAFDKTGTLTDTEAPGLSRHGEPLEPNESALVTALCRQSTHPYARRIAAALGTAPGMALDVAGFEEVPGRGMKAIVAGRQVVAGSKAWMESHGVTGDWPEVPAGSAVHVGIDGRARGVMVLSNRLRPRVDQLMESLSDRYELALLSGDNAHERDRFQSLFGDRARLHFNLSPQDKLAFIKQLQAGGRKVMMVGDGLNDAGALRQGDVGIAVVEGVGKFSPASDVILDSPRISNLGSVLEFSRRTARVVRAGFMISGAYNVIGVSIAAAGILSPVICAILMPLSSVTVVLFAVGATRWTARRCGLATTAVEKTEGALGASAGRVPAVEPAT
ncbi:MAG: heavy metal translocating P-type ATPase metal-binding domain-containing protein [Verrucomicrobiales bacterium]|nr:heavy metal translocating P-type ATPase metal-binding domain-containing protein [Verrucomicrobiales bacterium]